MENMNLVEVFLGFHGKGRNWTRTSCNVEVDSLENQNILDCMHKIR